MNIIEKSSNGIFQISGDAKLMSNRKVFIEGEITPETACEFVKKIIVHAPDKSSGHRRQKVQIVWNFIGEVNLPGDSQVIERQRKSRTA